VAAFRNILSISLRLAQRKTCREKWLAEGRKAATGFVVLQLVGPLKPNTRWHNCSRIDIYEISSIDNSMTQRDVNMKVAPWMYMKTK
jgi:hypothetical protein